MDTLGLRGRLVPIISYFFGIRIRIRFEDHNPPHFHAEYQGAAASFTMDGEVLAENKKAIPGKQKALIKAWALIHQDELDDIWQMCQESGEVFKIEGLS
jgi:hypothetical protein